MAVITCIEDLRVLAKRRVPRMFYDYADTGSWTESTYRANEADFQSIKLRQRVAVNIDQRSVAAKMIGVDVAMPVAIAPVGSTGMQHADGEILVARAAQKFGIPFTLSTMSICSIEDVAEAVKSPFWFQLYVMRDRGFTERLIDRAKAAGCGALVLTLDLQILGQRHKDLKNGLSIPPKPTIANLINLATKIPWCLEMLGTKRRRGRARHEFAHRVDPPPVRPAPQLGRRRVDQEALGRQADPEGHPGRRGREDRGVHRRRRADREQPRRPAARRRRVVDPRAARRRGCGGLEDRSAHGRRHPLGPGRAWAQWARRA